MSLLPLASVGGGSDASVEELSIHGLDLTIIIVYLLGIVALGCWAGLRKKADAKGSDYFLAGRSLKWPLIGLALFATNISTIHLVSLAEAGYTSGLLYGNFEWMAGFTLVLLALFFAPFYIRSNVATLPDFLEKRYNRGCRDWLAVLSIFSAIVVHIGFSLYTGAVVLEGSLLGAFVDNPEDYRLITIIVICGATALYTIIGGLMAVVLTESIQTVVLLLGAICITILGLYEMAGPEAVSTGLGRVAEGWGQLKESVHPVNFAMCRPDSDPTGLSWYAVFTGYWITGIWYWCTDQTIVQRVLGAKDENHARVGPLFASFIKILPVFIFVLPGLICLGLVQRGYIPELASQADGTPEAGKTYSHMIRHVLPIGAQGIVVAALLAALMSTVSGALNSIATLFSYDIYKRWRPQTGDRQLVFVGRVATFAAMIVAIIWSTVIGGLGKTIFQAMVDVFCAVAPPTAVVFFWGVFWKRASAKAALITLIAGTAIGAVVSALSLMKLNKIGDYQINSLLSCFLLAVVESIMLVVLSFIFPQKHTAESRALVWKTPWEALRRKSGGSLLLDFRLWVAAVLISMIGLYVYWRGDEAYYPVGGTVTLADGSPVAGAAVFLECDDERFSFRGFTDGKGKYAYGTTARAGGAPAGTVFRVRIEPRDLIVQMKKDPEDPTGTKYKFDQVLRSIPVGTVVTETVDENGKMVLTYQEKDNKDGEVKTRKVGPAADDCLIQHRPAIDFADRYGQFETSGLTCTIESQPMFTTQRTRYDFRLDE